MKIRYLTEADVEASLDVATTIDLLDRAARAHEAPPRLGRAAHRPLVAVVDARVRRVAVAPGQAGGEGLRGVGVGGGGVGWEWG